MSYLHLIVEQQLLCAIGHLLNQRIQTIHHNFSCGGSRLILEDLCSGFRKEFARGKLGRQERLYMRRFTVWSWACKRC